MEYNITIKNKLTVPEKIFVENLSMYIDKPLYFYGSILRSDYIKGKSDIDIDIFTDNTSSTIQKIGNLLNVKKYQFKKFILKIDNLIVNGYKIKYKDDYINTEISVYDEKYKNIILKEHNIGYNLPLYASIALFIIKQLFYNFKLISSKTYKNCKRFLMNKNAEMKFIELES